MATLEKIRNKAGLLVTAIGIALLAFIIGDFLKGGSTFFRQSKEKIAIVDGDAVSIQEFQQRLEETSNMYREQNNGMTLTDEQQSQIRESLFEEMVGSLLLENESKKVGFTVGKEELADMIMGNNVSPMIQQISYFQNQQTGRFEKNALFQFLQYIEADDLSAYSRDDQLQIEKLKIWWENVQQSVAKQKLLSKFAALLTTSLVTNSLDAKAAFDENAVNVDFNYVSQDYNTIPDPDVEVTDSEVAKLYDQRKSSFKQDAAKVIDYIVVNILPGEKDFAEAAKRMEEVRSELATTSEIVDVINENSEVPFVDAYGSASLLTAEEVKNFVTTAAIGAIDGPVLTGNIYNLYKLIDVKQGPDSIKANVFMLPNFDDEARSTAFTDSLIQVVKSGKTFAEMYAQLPGSQGDGSIGWATEASLTQAVDVKFKNTLFDANLNEVFVAKTTMGSFLVQVVEKTKPVTKYKVGIIRSEVSPSPETINQVYNDLNQYIVKNHNLESFKASAAEAGYVCAVDVPITENQPNIAPVENSRQVIRWAFENKKGAISDIFECQDYFVVAALEGTVKKGFRPLKDVADILKRELINEKKGEKIVANLKSQNFTSLEDYAKAMNTEPHEVKYLTFSTARISGIGFEPIVNAKAIAAEPDKLTGPFAGKNAVYVLAVTDKKISEQPYVEEVQKQQLDMQNGYRLMSLIQSNQLLKENAKIQDNRIRFY
ncbi:MAG: SurA N-terminal domain-containing protein [Candidatus Symbiothrix sp.]|jgi:peptidyl-prolyl cis-trans isomerase D|nr:SurA N-terminal domain-containing protein [Candidatus Symbiothrix sp.]